MTSIDYKDIDFSKLPRLEDVCSVNDIYLSDDKIIKIFKKYKKEELGNIEKKLELFKEKSTFDFLNIPESIIKQDGNLVGVVLPFIKNSMTLNELLRRKKIIEVLPILIDLSIDLSKLHRNKILVGDMHFDNIVIDDKNKDNFIDVESYGIESMKPSDMPSITYNYYNWMNYYLHHDANMDRISFFLALFSIIFDKGVISISENEYELKTEEIPILNELEDVFMDLKTQNYNEPDMPYLYELIRK